MITLIFSDKKTENNHDIQRICKLADYHPNLGEEYLIVYPERFMLRGEFQGWVLNTIQNHWKNYWIVTDNDLILLEFRVQIKHMRDASWFRLLVEEDGEVVEPNLDTDGRFDYLPKLLGSYSGLLRKLL